jgi:hypothetical protein
MCKASCLSAADLEALAGSVLRLHAYFQAYSWDMTWQSGLVRGPSCGIWAWSSVHGTARCVTVSHAACQLAGTLHSDATVLHTRHAATSGRPSGQRQLDDTTPLRRVLPAAR